MSRDRYTIYRQRYPHFITFTYINWVPLNSHSTIANIVLEALRFHQQERELVIYGWVFMENHIHLIVRSPNLSKTIHSIKSFIAQKILHYLKTEHLSTILETLYWGKTMHKTSQYYQVWQDGFHPIEIQSREMMNQKLEYVHNNPVKRGYVRRAEDWRYSSMGSYCGYREELLEICSQW